MPPSRNAPVARRVQALRPRALWRYLKDPGKPWGPKLAVVLAVVYFIVPVDLIPDVPLVGFLDDLGVLGAALAYLARNALADAESEAKAETDADQSSGT